ncbi:lipocalin family protein [Winogradskyella sp. A2]|uniref:lipocalin family protein n=1 Tax=Winogradskyella sp. A2 TaxID=3366944 RepID=UPI00398C32F2
MRKIILICFAVIMSCSNNPENYIEHLNGYWEIQEVILSDGTKRQYSINETIDFIQLNDSLKGFRKKMKPGINDTYYTSDDAEAITAKIEDNKLNLYYTTLYSNWKETVLEASKDQLKVLNENNVVYLYKRYQPINLEIE